MGEDVNTVSPTLGFNIKTIDYEGYAPQSSALVWHTVSNSATAATNLIYVWRRGYRSSSTQAAYPGTD